MQTIIRKIETSRYLAFIEDFKQYIVKDTEGEVMAEETMANGPFEKKHFLFVGLPRYSLSVKGIYNERKATVTVKIKGNLEDTVARGITNLLTDFKKSESESKA